jgi:exopolysaccharide biosynthesis WecB/TagA/CpsF family protein
LIIVDDGSKIPVCQNLNPEQYPFPISIIRQVSMGVATARNHGIAKACGQWLLFIDSDCVLQPKCLRHVLDYVSEHPDEQAFQLNLAGDKASVAGCLEHIRILATQQILTGRDGKICYINTAAFAIERNLMETAGFNPAAVRGEDTALLAELMRRNILPSFLSSASVNHCIDIRLWSYIFKHIKIGYYTGYARKQLNAYADRMPSGFKKAIFREMCSVIRKENLKWRYLCGIGISYILENIGRTAYVLAGLKPGRISVLSSSLDIVREQELLARCILSIEKKQGLILSYLTAWSLVQAEMNTQCRDAIVSCDLCYADGMGVVWAVLLLHLRRARKVTANSFYPKLFEEIENRQYRIALIGGHEHIAHHVKGILIARFPRLNIVTCLNGYSDVASKTCLIDKIRQDKPDMIILAMGQPLQEQLAIDMKKQFPNKIFWCVGGLFDVITGNYPCTPRFIRDIGFEWLCRLLYSPKKVWKRYFIGIPLLFYFILQKNFVRLLSKIWPIYIIKKT